MNIDLYKDCMYPNQTLRLSFIWYTWATKIPYTQWTSIFTKTACTPIRQYVFHLFGILERPRYLIHNEHRSLQRLHVPQSDYTSFIYLVHLSDQDTLYTMNIDLYKDCMYPNQTIRLSFIWYTWATKIPYTQWTSIFTETACTPIRLYVFHLFGILEQPRYLIHNEHRSLQRLHVPQSDNTSFIYLVYLSDQDTLYTMNIDLYWDRMYPNQTIRLSFIWYTWATKIPYTQWTSIFTKTACTPIRLYVFHLFGILERPRYLIHNEHRSLLRPHSLWDFSGMAGIDIPNSTYSNRRLRKRWRTRCVLTFM